MMEGERYYVRARLAIVLAAVFGTLGMAVVALFAEKPLGGRYVLDGQILLFHALGVLAINSNNHLWGWRQSIPMALMILGSGLIVLNVLSWLITNRATLAILDPIGLVIFALSWLTLAAGVAVKPLQ